MPLLPILLVATAGATQVGGALSVQSRSLAAVSGPQIQHRSAGPAIAATVGSGRPFGTDLRFDLAQNRAPDANDNTYAAGMSMHMRNRLGPLRWGAKASLRGESLGGASPWSTPDALAPRLGRLDVSGTAGIDTQAGRTHLSLAVGTPVLGVLARPGTTAADPELVRVAAVQAVSLPVALGVTGPWNAPGLALDASASWDAGPGEAWVAIHTTVERLDIGHLERRLTVVQPEVGWRWGRRTADRCPSPWASPDPTEDTDQHAIPEAPTEPQSEAPAPEGPPPQVSSPPTDPGLPPRPPE